MANTISPLAISFFAAFVLLTVAITYFASKRTKTASEFYAAGGRITAWQNGWALAGDFLSAAALLGIAGIITNNGFDGLVYSIGWLVGWPIMLFLVVEPLRNVGKFTIGDLVAYRLRQRWVRSAAALGSLTVIVFYLIAQMVATGSLIKLLFGLPYPVAVAIVGIAMLVYVLFGGMIATTWVQIVKAILLMIGVATLAALVLSRCGWSPQALFVAAAQEYGAGVLAPGTKVVAAGWETISLALALMFGTAAMPHVLMRIYTVRDVSEARLSIVYATGLIGLFHLLVLIIGFGAMVFVGPRLVAQAGGGGNMAAPLLAQLIGGDAFFGFICAVSFATMLAVVAGLTLSGVTILCHDIWSNAIRGGEASEKEQFLVARVATIVIAAFAIILAVAFEGQNVAFMVGLAFSVACSANFPTLVLSISWKRLTTAGAVASILFGTLASIVTIVLSPTVQIDLLRKSVADLGSAWWFVPLRNPAILTMPLSFVIAIAVSMMSREQNAEAKFADMKHRIMFGSAPGADKRSDADGLPLGQSIPLNS